MRPSSPSHQLRLNVWYIFKRHESAGQSNHRMLDNCIIRDTSQDDNDDCFMDISATTAHSLGREQLLTIPPGHDVRVD